MDGRWKVSEWQEWVEEVDERMVHLDVHKRKLAHWYIWRDGEARVLKNEKRVNEGMRCRYDGCERLCNFPSGERERLEDGWRECEGLGSPIPYANFTHYVQSCERDGMRAGWTARGGGGW